MIGERFTFAELTRTSSTPLQQPGSYHTIEKQDGSTVVVKYCQAAAAGDLDGTTIAAGMGGYLMAPASPYDTPYLTYKVTNHVVNNLIVFTHAGTAAPCAVVGVAAAPIAAEYWGWLIVWGHTGAIADTSSSQFDVAGALARFADNAGNGNFVQQVASPLYDQAIGFSTAVHSTAWVSLFVTIGLKY